MTAPGDDADLRTAVANLLGRPVGELTTTGTPIDAEVRLHSVTGGVVRVRGNADGEPFSLVVKSTRNGVDADPEALWVSGDAETHRNYWKREWLSYSTGLLGRLPGRLRAPRLLLATEPAPDEGWMYLEDVQGLPGATWQPQHYARCAHDLGTTQGALAAGPASLPDDAWLSRGWLEGWVRTTQRWWPLVEDDAAWRDPRLAPLEVLRRGALEVWAARDELLATVAAAPQTLVHLDFWPPNVLVGDDGRAVAVDWSSVGIGALGQDLDQLTMDPVWMQVRPEGDLGLLERAVLPAYAWGVRTAGFAVGDAELRRWYAAAAGVRYVSVLATQADIAADPVRVEAMEKRWQRPFADLMADRARVVAHAVDLAQESLAG